MNNSDTSYTDSKIKPAVRELLTGDGGLRERISKNFTGLAFLATDKTERFKHESKLVKKVLDKVKNDDFSEITDAEVKAVAEAALFVHTKLAIAEAA
jgi:hypothetical protein